MRKAIDNCLSLGKLLDGESIEFLIQEESCLLTILNIYPILNTVLYNLNLCIKFLSNKALLSFQAFLLTNPGIASLINTANLDAIFSKNLYQIIQNFLLHPINAQGQRFHNKYIFILIHNKSWQIISLTENHTT